MKSKKNISFKFKIIGIIGIFIIATFALMTVLFYNAGVKLRNQAIESLKYTLKDVSSGIDETILNIYGVSDAFAIDDRIDKYTQNDYDGRTLEKRQATTKIYNQIFASYDMLKRNEKMAAILTSKNELFNFIDPNMSETECLKKLDELDVNNKDKLAKFCWYGVGDNFLRDTSGLSIRRQKVIIGSRRVFSNLKSSYTCVHIFAVDEETIYNHYKEAAAQFDADVFVISGDGQLISSSNEETLKDGKMDDRIKGLAMGRKSDSFEIKSESKLISVNKSNVNDWLTIIVVPLKSITGTQDMLFAQLVISILFCVLFALFMILYLYRDFMKPISTLKNSMHRVFYGELDAYVDAGKNDEMGEMIKYYNSMLSSINNNIMYRLEVEKKKKELQLEVLMNQINPHFLYNTLETIVWKSNAVGHPDIGRIAASLGRMYRLSASSREMFVLIKQELEHVMTYIKIQENRYGDSFKFMLCVDYHEINDLYTLKIILQPIVENAILYGMNGLKRQMKIRLKIKVYPDYLKVLVTDSGAGMSRKKLMEIKNQIITGIKMEENTNKRKSTGIGMHNVYERIRLYFGDDYKLTIYSLEHVGTSVMLKIPRLSYNDVEKKRIDVKQQNSPIN